MQGSLKEQLEQKIINNYDKEVIKNAARHQFAIDKLKLVLDEYGEKKIVYKTFFNSALMILLEGFKSVR